MLTARAAARATVVSETRDWIIVNTFAILEIIYIYFFSKPSVPAENTVQQ